MMNYWKPYENIRKNKIKYIVAGSCIATRNSNGLKWSYFNSNFPRLELIGPEWMAIDP
jgi:hypothetical protein